MAGRREFDWDDAKARGNVVKHGLPFDYAARVFLDPDRAHFRTPRQHEGAQSL
jgi:uncharacterized DUF497 family protein